jgi:hypothetical protein
MTKTTTTNKILTSSVALILAAFAPLGVALAAPQSAAQHSELWRTDAGRVAKITEGQVEVLAAERADSPLAQRMIDVLTGNARPPREVRPSGETVAAGQDSRRPLSWSCGPWRELWQGSGQARTCEWR